jgi:hypothetical protein
VADHTVAVALITGASGVAGLLVGAALSPFTEAQRARRERVERRRERFREAVEDFSVTLVDASRLLAHYRMMSTSGSPVPESNREEILSETREVTAELARRYVRLQVRAPGEIRSRAKAVADAMDKAVDTIRGWQADEQQQLAFEAYNVRYREYIDVANEVTARL